MTDALPAPGPAGSIEGEQSAGTAVSAGAPGRGVTVDRVGPGGGVPSDSAFGVALVTLWQLVADAGGLVGFSAPAVRSEIAARAAGLVDEIRTGRVIAVVANRSHRLIGAALLRPGRGSHQHTGRVELILIAPAHARGGLGSQLMERLIGIARERGLERLDLDAADGVGLEGFVGRFGFVEWGRRPGWIRTADGDHDEIGWGMTL